MARNTSPQNATPTALSPAQLRALEVLLAGDTVTAAADAAAVDRTTVHRWLRQDFAFLAAYNRGRRDLHDATEARLLAVARTAADTVQTAVEGGDVRAALAVLRGLGLLDGEPPTHGADDEDVLREDAQLRADEHRAATEHRRRNNMILGLV